MISNIQWNQSKLLKIDCFNQNYMKSRKWIESDFVSRRATRKLLKCIWWEKFDFDVALRLPNTRNAFVFLLSNSSRMPACYWISIHLSKRSRGDHRTFHAILHSNFTRKSSSNARCAFASVKELPSICKSNWTSPSTQQRTQQSKREK